MAALEKVRQFSKKLKITFRFDLEIPLLGIDPRKLKKYLFTENLYKKDHSVNIHSSPKWKESKYPSTDD
jgi:hypothetical protein